MLSEFYTFDHCDVASGIVLYNDDKHETCHNIFQVHFCVYLIKVFKLRTGVNRMA